MYGRLFGPLDQVKFRVIRLGFAYHLALDRVTGVAYGILSA